jgi:hypothetical protein
MSKNSPAGISHQRFLGVMPGAVVILGSVQSAMSSNERREEEFLEK